MSSGPIIAFGQQPCGFFRGGSFSPEIQTARRLQREIGGEIVFFCHDSDHDPRETQTLLRERGSGRVAMLNFTFENKVQRKWSPLFLKRVPAGWAANLARQLPAYVEPAAVAAFKRVTATTIADFCLEMYRRMGLLEGIPGGALQRSGLRRAACAIPEFFVDVPHEGEIVRARCQNGALSLHAGGDAFVALPAAAFTKEQISPARDTRLRWMQSVLHCTHYIAGAGEQAYLNRKMRPRLPS